jgi:hypothetical protein
MVVASLTNGAITFSMEVPDAGWLPTSAKSPTPTTTTGRKSGLVILPIFGRFGDAGQDTGTHSLEFTIEGLALAADVTKIDELTFATQIDPVTGAGKNTLTVRGNVKSSLGIKSYTATDVEGSTLLWRYSIQLIEILEVIP